MSQLISGVETSLDFKAYAAIVSTSARHVEAYVDKRLISCSFLLGNSAVINCDVTNGVLKSRQNLLI